MRKIINVVIGIVIILLLLMTYISFNIDKNIKLRYWLSEHFQKIEIESNEPAVYFLGIDQVYIDASDFLVAEPNYVNLEWLKEIDATYQYDVSKGILSLIWNGNLLVVDSNGQATLNTQKITEFVTVKVMNDQIYIAAEALNTLEGFDQIGVHILSSEDHQTHIVTLDAIQYQMKRVNHKSYLLKSEDKLKNSQLLKAYPKISDILKQLSVVDSIETTHQIISYEVEADIALIFNGRTIGYGLNQFSDSTDASVYKYAADDFYPDKKAFEHPIFLVWEAVYSKNPNTEQIPKMNGVNVVSPTWVELKTAQGDITEKVSIDYLKWSRVNNLETWILATNAFDPDLTHDFLSSYAGRKQFIDQMITLCLEYGINGINLDFENIYLKDKDILSHFVNELAWQCNEFGVTLSMDVTVMDGSDNWSKCFDRRVLGKIVDYLVIMTYDEYWASSPISGPVSSYDWVESSLMKIIKVVPSHKVVMGLPFYTRVWTENLSNEEADKVKVTSKAIGMVAQNALIAEKALSPIWNEQEGLFYVSYIEENSIHKIWVENEVTLSKKAALVKKLGLKGIACWRRGFEDISVYDMLLKEIEE
ncbi:glycosyl hydrolase family 18 protein [Fusibacter sp. 3D3]|uniref:glycosyl hydrolase family 18 protein n=1 Tax=Fusibacter sp. 3D3 TaxID=1048380 RepID=UPI0008531D63|nr:glycosyl hydrolase family 18 protein [Fusibacter sp. 3D3]GAU79318.1 spore peptidoglycan hydrolase [Fusibacter sp. 3D3]